MIVPCKLSIYSVYDCLSVGRYVRLVGGFFITASKYLRDRTTRRMEDALPNAKTLPTPYL